MDDIIEFKRHLKEDNEMLDAFVKKHLDLLKEQGKDKSFLTLSIRSDPVYVNAMSGALMRSLCDRSNMLKMLKKVAE